MNAEQYQTLLKTMADLQTSVDAGFASLDVQELREQLGAKPDELVPEPDIPDWVDGRSERVWERIEEEIEEEPSLTTFPDEPSWTQQYAREQEQDGRATGATSLSRRSSACWCSTCWCST